MHGYRTLALLLTVPLAILAACGDDDDDDASSPESGAEIVLVHWDEEAQGVVQPPDRLDADPAVIELTGTLAIESGCPTIMPDGDAQLMVLVWPPGFSATVAGENVVIQDEGGNAVATERDTVTVNGAQIESGAELDEFFNADEVEDCPQVASYLLVGEISAGS